MIQLITDRTELDVLYGTEKGKYNAEDLNRVEKAVEELIPLAKKIGANKTITVKTDWDIPGPFSDNEWPTISQMKRYLNNVMYLCEAVELNANIPNSMERLNWEGANQIEAAIETVYSRIQKIIQIFRYSGEFFAGEETCL